MLRIGALVATAAPLSVVLCMPSAGATTTTTRSTATKLVGTNWVLTDSPSLGAGVTVNDVSAHFSRKTVSGSSGCNSYDATYRVDGSKMTIGPKITSTMRACTAGPAAVESAYLARLVRVTSYAIKGSTLSLSGRRNALLLRYTSNGPGAIVGKWSVTSYYTGSALQSVIIGTPLTAEFTAHDMTGNGGCNAFGGSYETSGDKISIGPLVSTKLACVDTAIDAQEQQYFAALALARSYRVSGNRLDLLREGGTIAVSFDAVGTR